MPKSYNLVLDSSKAVDKTSGTSAYKYYVNWGSFLPDKETAYEVSFSFVSGPLTDDPSVFLNISVDFGSNYITNGNGSSNIIGLLRVGAFADASSTVFCYNALMTDNVPVDINRPSNSTITVTIKDGDLLETNPLNNFLIY